MPRRGTIQIPREKEVKAVFRGIAILAVVALAALRVAAFWVSIL